jgi:multidrug efflux pump subunit AcrB
MSINVSTWSIRNPIPSLLLFALLTLLGLISFHRMKVQSMPDIDLPLIIVTAALPGAAPGQLETDVARKIENSLATVQGIKHVYTKVQDGSVNITVEFRLEKPGQEALDNVRDAVARVRSDMPADLRDPVVQKMDMAGSPILTYTVAADRLDDEALSWFVDNTVAKTLLSVPGVGQVSRVGGVSREVRIELDPAKLLALNASAADISRQLRLVQQEASGGRADVGGAEQSVRTVATVKSADELAAMDVGLSDGRHIRLDQVASVSDTVAERRAAALFNGKPVVGFEITRSRNGGELEVQDGVGKAVAELAAAHPEVHFEEVFNFVDPVREDYESSMHLMYEGAALAVLVVWVFLRNWRATLVAATALPLSIIPAFMAMDHFHFSINTVSLISLSLVVGILVDDAIVEIENIMRHLSMGKTPFQAAMEAADEIGLAVIATTFALIAVFLPTAFMNGVIGRFFVQFGGTAAIAVFASLMVARMLTPMMAAFILKPDAGHRQQLDGPVMRRYLAWAGWCLHHRWITAGLTALFFVFSIWLATLLPVSLFPADDLSQSQVTLELPPGSTFEETLAIAEAARLIVQRNPHVKLVYTAVGGGASGSDPFAFGGVAEVRKASLTLRLSPRGERPRKQIIERDLREALLALPGARVKVGLGGMGEKYVLVLAGEEGPALTEATLRVEKDLRTIPGLGAITSTASLTRPEIVVRPDFAKAADLGVTSAAIAETLRIATAGDYDVALPKLNLAQRQVPIVVKLPASAREDIELLKRLAVPGARGPVMLGNVAELSIDSGPAVIDRYDRLRNVNLEIELNNQPLGDIAAKVQTLPSLRQLPPGVSQNTVGDAEMMGELFSGFAIAMATGVLCIYLVLVLLFKDFMQPLTILAALPLSLGGAFAALLIGRSSMAMPALLGLVMLMGIATKNSILLVEYAIVARRDHGMGRFEALIDACHKRARPIVMTTIAMAAGMLPTAIGVGVDPSFRSPMAIAVIGGLVTSTFLSLLVIPVVFTFVDDAAQWLARQLHKRRAAQPAEPIPAK